MSSRLLLFESGSGWEGQIVPLYWRLGGRRAFLAEVRVVFGGQADAEMDARNPDGYWFYAVYV